MPGGTPYHRAPSRPWLPREIALAAGIWQREFTAVHGSPERLPKGVRQDIVKKIAKLLNRSYISVLGRLDNYGGAFQNTARRGRPDEYMASRATPDAMAERDRRSEAADARDLTGFLMGDPPRGYSALDCLQKGLGHERNARTERPDSVNHGRDSF